MPKYFILVFISLFFLSSCSYFLPHRIDIQQGNILEQEKLNQVQLGMGKAQVQFVLGTPMLMDHYHFNRWDYIYTLREGRSDMVKDRLTLYFEDDELIRVAGNMQLNVEIPEKQAENDVLVVPLKTGDGDNTWYGWFNFWSDDNEVANEPEPNAVNHSSNIDKILNEKAGDKGVR